MSRLDGSNVKVPGVLGWQGWPWCCYAQKQMLQAPKPERFYPAPTLTKPSGESLGRAGCGSWWSLQKVLLQKSLRLQNSVYLSY